ncbi:Gfo/Idh/MocA family protein [Parenemella sanctibonifatiensis]|uniref:Oxidoreductase n=1 Tax=Parenemella sanctibonifatiensis TaxID=2016505 RepID=A0A255EN99_9ACTN|nr:Gfo/Idh/MocA family oxidoreductase [Parenemella sanctibonifatiensis]OYN86477.1 oxidoreductase [Parenemella sanctibonifatiensis]OYN91085.1 oxidoreductase [Parenemella sanctibonifatiensis]
MEPIRLGVIGQGRSGRNIHTEFLKTLPEKYEIVAISDLIEDRRTRAEGDYPGVKTYADYRDMLADKSTNIELVINASFSHHHPQINNEVMEAGYHVLSEKPAARRAADVHENIATSTRTGKLFAVFQQSRHAPYYRAVMDVLRSGKLGEIQMVKIFFNGFARRYDWQVIQGFNAGNLLNTGPHPLDQALGFIGRDVQPQVWAKMANVNAAGDAEDFVKILLTAPGRPVVDLEVCSNNHFNPYTYQVYGTYGSLAGSMTHLDWKYYDPAEAPEQKLAPEPLPGPSYCKEDLNFIEESWDVADEDKDLFRSMATRFYTNLFEAVRNGVALTVPPEQVAQQVAVIEECHRQNPLPVTFEDAPPLG